MNFLLTHHHSQDWNRCYQIGNQRFCARCLGLYPAMLFGILMQFRFQVQNQTTLSLVLGIVLVVPASIDWALGQFFPKMFSNEWRTFTGIMLGCGLGPSLGIHFQKAFPAILLIQLMVFGVTVLVVVFIRLFRR